MHSKYATELKKITDRINSNDIIGVVHHDDSDGNCAGVIIAKALEKLRGRRIDFEISGNYYDIKEFCSKCIRKKANYVFITDITAEQQPQLLKELSKHATVILLDHHKSYGDVSSKNILFIKSHFYNPKIEPAKYCAAKLCYDLFSELVDLSDIDWICSIGIIGDMGYEQWKDFVDTALKKQGLKVKKDIFQTEFGKINSLVLSSRLYSMTLRNRIFEILYDADNYKDVLKSELQKAGAVIEEINWYLKNHKKFMKKYGDLLLFEIKPKYGINADLSTQLAGIYPHNTIIVAVEMRGKIAISARRADFKKPMNTLLEKATEGISDSNAGGHSVAAGAGVRKNDYEKVIGRIISLS